MGELAGVQSGGGRMAEDRQEGLSGDHRDAGGGNRGSDLSRVDRRAAPSPRRALLPPALHASPPAQQMVGGQPRARQTADRRGPDEAARPRGVSGGGG